MIGTRSNIVEYTAFHSILMLANRPIIEKTVSNSCVPCEVRKDIPSEHKHFKGRQTNWVCPSEMYMGITDRAATARGQVGYPTSCKAILAKLRKVQRHGRCPESA